MKTNGNKTIKVGMKVTYRGSWGATISKKQPLKVLNFVIARTPNTERL